MPFRAIFEPIPVDFPDRLAAPHASTVCADERRICRASPLSTVYRPRSGWVLLALVVLCLVPRAIAAWKIGGICPDGVLYVQLAKALEQGAPGEALARINLNLYPVVLMLVHGCGLDWELGAKIWGVVISSLVVLPLYGWVRHQFDDRVALAACFLYAVHTDLIRWSGEVVRDPTFWFLFVLSLYSMWRAITEVRLSLFLAAGLAIALAALTRFEGLFLFLPLALWTTRRARGNTFHEARDDRKRLILGAAMCAGILPALLVLASAVWLRGHAPWELLRSDPLTLVADWGRAVWARIGDPASAAYSSLAWTRMIELFGLAMIKGLTPLFTAGMLVGVIGWWRVWRRPCHQATCATILVVLLAIWIHLYSAHVSCQRYFLPIALMMCPFAGLGLLACSARLLRWARGWRPAAFVPAAFVGTVSMAIVLGADCRYRAERAELGRWAHERFGPSPSLLGPDGITQVVEYYAHGRCESFPADTCDEAVAAHADRFAPDLLLVPPKRAEALLARMASLGFARIDGAELPEQCGRVHVLARQGRRPPTPLQGANVIALSAVHRPPSTVHNPRSTVH
jgi:hypothetical protein